MKKFQIALALALNIQQPLLPSVVTTDTNISFPTVSVTRSTEAGFGIADNVAEETFSSLQSGSIALSALNPGYTIDGVQNVGEFIELRNTSGEPTSLTGYMLRYTNATGNRSNLYVFPEGSMMLGETLLLRLASSPEASQSDLTYTRTMALEAGPLELVYQDEVIDSVCWHGGADCLTKFVNKEGQRTSIVKDFETGVFSHQQDYAPSYDPARPGYQPPTKEEEHDSASSQCRGLEFSELYTYYEADQSEQFIELYNSSDEPIMLTGCHIKYKNKTIALSGDLPGGGYFVSVPEVALTKNPTSTNSYELVDVTGDVVDTVNLPHGQKKAAAYASFGLDESGEEQWLVTYARTPGEENVYQQYKSCTEGKVINEATGNCVKAATIKAVTDCPEGKYRNPETGRCKAYEDSTTKECKEGYERNPETGRCRKIKNNDGADYPLVPKTASEKATFIALYAVLAVVAVGVIYIIYQYRNELKRFIYQLLHPQRHHQKNHRKKKHS